MRGRSTFSAYLFRILINTCNDMLRSRKHAEFANVDVANLPVVGPEPDAGPGHAVQGFAPPVEEGNVQAGDGRGIIAELKDFLFDGEPGEKILRPGFEAEADIFVSRFLRLGRGRENNRSGQPSETGPNSSGSG